MRMGKVGSSLFIGGGLSYIFGLNTYIGLGFSLIIFLLWSVNGNLKEEETR